MDRSRISIGIVNLLKIVRGDSRALANSYDNFIRKEYLMKFRKFISLIISLLLFSAFGINVFASTPEAVQTFSEDGSAFTEKGISSETNSQITRDQRSYWKSAVVQSYSEKGNPSWSDWPQTIYYSEPNPYGSGTAHGTLSLAGYTHIQEIVPG